MKKNIIKEYTNGEVTVIWKPDMCIHSAICARDLSSVFDPKARPWINMDGADTETIIQQVQKCPSGALSYFRNKAAAPSVDTAAATRVEVMRNGPLLIHGQVKVVDKEGREEIKNNTTAFCRCGGSRNKPYCDGQHLKNGFQD